MPPSSHAPLTYTPQRFRAGRLRGLVHPHLVRFFRDLPRVDQLPIEPDMTVYMQRPNVVREVRLPPEAGVPWLLAVMKQFGWRGVQHYLFSPLKRSRAMKAYRTACHLLAHQLGTPVPLGVCEERRWGFVQYNMLATEAITDYVTLRQYYRSRPSNREDIDDVLRLTATYLRRMHDSGIWHRDMVLANVLMVGPPGARRLYVVDLNRAYHLSRVPMLLRAMELARTEWTEWYPRFVELYCDGRYTAARMLWIMRLYRRWRTVRGTVRNRVVKPLRQRLRR